VPTLWHVLHVDRRPAVWRRTSIEGYDQSRVGLAVEELDKLPTAAVDDKKLRREYFQTTVRGKSAAGHEFVEELSEDEKTAVLEYLKTL
jgi:hypothetical protein